jgi:CheY-like chemotaxis protein
MLDDLPEYAPSPDEDISKTLHLDGKTVLIVEDYEPNLCVMAEYLDMVNCALDTADNGKIAHEKIQRRDYDLVLMDCSMPVWDGIKATREIRKLDKGRKLPILALTANDTAKDIEDCLAAGMNEVLVKPVDRRTLYAKLEYWLCTGAAVQKVHGLSSSGPASKTNDTFNHSANSLNLIDFEALVGELEDREIAHQMVDGFLKILPQQFRKIKESIEAGDAETVNREAHSIKGGAANIFAVTLQDAALKLERASEDRLSEDAFAIFQFLQDTAEKLRCYYREKLQ